MSNAAEKLAKHTFTPGPWRMGDGYCCNIKSANNKIVAVTLNVMLASKKQQPFAEENSETVKANARLIAASPTLLALLKRAPNYISENNGYQETAFCAEIRAALASVEAL